MNLKAKIDFWSVSRDTNCHALSDDYGRRLRYYDYSENDNFVGEWRLGGGGVFNYSDGNSGSNQIAQQVYYYFLWWVWLVSFVLLFDVLIWCTNSYVDALWRQIKNQRQTMTMSTAATSKRVRSTTAASDAPQDGGHHEDDCSQIYDLPTGILQNILGYLPLTSRANLSCSGNTVNNHTEDEILWLTCRRGWHRTQRVRRCVRTQWGDTPHKLCPPSRHEIRHAHKISFESYYFCVALRSGCLMLMSGSRQNVRVPRWCVFWVITVPFHTKSRHNVLGAVIPPVGITQNTHPLRTRPFFCNHSDYME